VSGGLAGTQRGPEESPAGATLTAATKSARRRLPILEGVLPIDRTRIGPEVIAGATLAALAIPETMGYATMDQNAGHHRPLHDPDPIFLFALLGSSRHLVWVPIPRRP
jgi:MFS superfamily sulfate permease-like transporter